MSRLFLGVDGGGTKTRFALLDEQKTLVADATLGTTYHPDVGIDGHIEFRDEDQKATGVGYRVQLKSGDAHLRARKDGTEIFAMKPHYEALWTAKTAEDGGPSKLSPRELSGPTMFGFDGVS